MWVYHWFAEGYGWDPRTVDELSLEEAYWLPVMREAMSASQEQLRDK